LRIEFLDDSPAAVERTLTLDRDVIAGQRESKALWRQLRASNQCGVTRVPLAVLN
jgi:putative protease